MYNAAHITQRPSVIRVASWLAAVLAADAAAAAPTIQLLLLLLSGCGRRPLGADYFSDYYAAAEFTQLHVQLQIAGFKHRSGYLIACQHRSCESSNFGNFIVILNFMNF